MTVWEQIEKIGRGLQNDFLQYHRRIRDGLPEKLAEQRARLDEMNPLGAAIRRFYEGDKNAIAEYVRNHAVSDEDQSQLTDFLVGKLAPPKRSKGQPPSNTLGATEIAEKFYKEWRKANERAGLKDHGHRKNMKVEAVKFICEDFLSRIYGMSGEGQQEKVLANLNRPLSRRKIRH